MNDFVVRVLLRCMHLVRVWLRCMQLVRVLFRVFRVCRCVRSHLSTRGGCPTFFNAPSLQLVLALRS